MIKSANDSDNISQNPALLTKQQLQTPIQGKDEGQIKQQSSLTAGLILMQDGAPSIEVLSEGDEFDVDKELDKLINPIQREVRPFDPNKKKKRATEQYSVHGNYLLKKIVEAFIQKGFNKDYAQSRLSESINNYQYITLLGRVFIESLRKQCEYLSSIWQKKIKVKDLGLDVLIKELTYYRTWMNQEQCKVFHKILQITVELHQPAITQAQVLTLYRRLEAQRKIYKSKTGPYAYHNRKAVERQVQIKNTPEKRKQSEIKKFLKEKTNFHQLRQMKKAASYNTVHPERISGNRSSKVDKNHESKESFPVFLEYQYQSIAAFYKQPSMIHQFLSKQYPHISWNEESVGTAINQTLKAGIMKVVHKSQEARYLRRQLPCLILSDLQIQAMFKNPIPSQLSATLMSVVLHGIQTDIAIRDRVLQIRQYLKNVLVKKPQDPK